MTFTVNCDNTDVVSCDAVIEHIRERVDLRDHESLLSVAPLLKSLANDRQLIVRQLNRQILDAFKWDSVPSAQVIYLGRGEDFFLRANIWPSTADIASGRVFQDQFSYYAAHDHNYDFLTVPYSGSGYVTEIFDYDFDRVNGVVGETVDLRLVERRHFCGNQVMLYRASKDVHIQFPPDDLSITLNLLAFSPAVRLRDQFFFDTETQTVMPYADALEGSRRVSMLDLAGYAGDMNTVDLLEHLVDTHPCRRSRLAALESMARLAPEQQDRIWTKGADDKANLVSEASRRHLARLDTAAGQA